MLDGAVRLGPVTGDTLALAEGTESALAYTEMFGVVTWAVLGKSRFAKVAIPAQVKRLHICADADSVDVCEKAGLAYRRRDLEVTVHVPERGKDFNDMLLAWRRRAA
jgi:hypothetical protein